jgi:tellurite resistance protein TerC
VTVAWEWTGAAAALIPAVAAEIFLTRRGTVTVRQAAQWIAVYVSLAALCGQGLGVMAAWATASQFYVGYLTKCSLSLDNLFVFTVMMTWFAVPPARQPRVLLLGIGLAPAMRSALTVAWATALNRFGWLFYPLGGILLRTAAGLILRPQTRPDSQLERNRRVTAWLWWRSRQATATGAASLPVLVVAIGRADPGVRLDSIRPCSASRLAPRW